MGCVYTLKLNNKSVLNSVSEEELRKYIKNNISEFDQYSTLSIRYQMTFDQATSALKSYNDAQYKQLLHDRKLARQKAAIRAMHPEVEASEDWGKDTTSILHYAEDVANQYIDGFNLANWKKNKAIFYEEHREELANILPLDKDLNLSNMPKEQLDILINLALEKEIKSWDYRASLGKGLHYVMSAIMNSKNQRGDLTSQRYKDDLIDKMLEHLEEDDERNNYIGNNRDIIMKFIDDIVDFKFKTILFGKGDLKPSIFTDFIIDGTTSMGEHIRGKIDLLVVYPDGSIDIYDLKTSTTNYQYWDANKKKIYQYQLGYYKRLLSTLGFSSNKINIHIIPAKLDYDKLNDTHMSNVSVQEVWSIVNTSDENTRINSDIKLNMSVAENSIINNVEKRLTALFSKINFIQGIQGRTRESIKLNFMSRTSDGKFRLNNIFSENNKIEIYNTEEEVEKAIDKMLEQSKEAVVTNVAHITNLLSAELKRRNNNKNKTFYETYQYGYLNPVLPANFVGNYVESMVNMQLQPYRLEAGWEVVTSDDFTNMGIIVLVNQYTKQIDIISVVNNDPKIKVDLDNGGDTLLGLKSSEISGNEMISNIGNIETIKQLCVIDELLNLPEYSEYKVNALKQLSMVKNTGTYLEMDIERAVNTYKKLCTRKSLNSNSDIQAVDRVERAYIAYINAVQISSDNASWKNILKVDNTIVSNNRADKARAIKSLQELRDSLKNTFFKESNPDVQNNTPEAYLFNLISTELAYLQGTSIDLLNSNPIDKYGFRKALKNRSLLNGTDLNSIDTIPIIRGIYDVYFKTNKEIRRIYTEQYKSLDTKETKKFYDDAFSLVNNKVINAYAVSFKNLLDTSEDGKKRFLMKDPYDPSTTLNKALRNYAKYWLAQINAYRYNLNPEMLLKRDKPIEKVIEEWEDRFDEEISELRYSGKYFEIPLANASASSMLLNKHFNVKRLWSKGKEDITNPTENILNNEESDEIEMEVDLELNEMYDHFNSTDSNEDYRKAVLAKGDPTQFFETNLELVKDMYIFSKIRKLKYDKIIPSINNALVQLAYVRKITGKPSKDLELFIIDFMKSSVFNKHLIDKNMTPFIALVNQLKKISSLAILGFNYISGTKETFVGYLTLVNRALSNMSNEHDRKYRYSAADMLKAYNFVWVDALKQVNNITLLEHLNRVTGISNVDVNSLVEESNYSRSSLGRFSNRMFWNNRAPDFLNRMTIIVSYMMKYGIMDAYKVNKETGMLEYNWRKDKRFERYAKNDLSNKELYNDLKALYNRMKREFIEDGYTIINPDGTSRAMTMDDDLPEAFTTTENKKFKSESDMIFGYMDHDVKSLFFRRSAGVLFGQFMTYITAKKNQWFLTRKQYGDGHWEHMTNNEGLKLYFKYYEKNGQLMNEITTEVTDDPVWDWKGDVYEGIFWSLLDLSKALISLDNKNISAVLADPIKRRNCVYALNDLFMALVLLMVARMLLNGEDDSGATKTAARIITNTRRDINPIEIFGGVMDISVTSLDFAKNLVSSTWELTTGDTDILKYLGKNVSAFRPIKDAIVNNLK